MTLNLIFTPSILLCFAAKVNMAFWKILLILIAIIVEMPMSLMDLLSNIYVVNALRVRRLWHNNECSADILGIFDLKKMLNRNLSFHDVYGLRRLIKLLSSERLLAFSER